MSAGLRILDGGISTAVVPELGTTYRFYVNLQDPTDQVSAVYGNNNGTLAINAPEGVYNSGFNASGMRLASQRLLWVWPQNWQPTLTPIGLMVLRRLQKFRVQPTLACRGFNGCIGHFFITDGATSLLANTQTGSSWFVTDAANALPQGDDLRVLVLQVTTTGTISGQLNYKSSFGRRCRSSPQSGHL